MMAARSRNMSALYGAWYLLLLSTFAHPVLGLEHSGTQVLSNSAGNFLEKKQAEESSVVNIPLPTNVPPVEDFTRRAYSRVAVIGDYIYLDAGEVAQDNPVRALAEVNGTLAIDLRMGWNPSEVEIVNNEYGRNGKQALSSAALMVNQTEGSIYTWGGRSASAQPIREQPELWKFRPSEGGRGEWTDVTPSDRGFTDRRRSHDAAVAGTPGKAFIFGGLSTDTTTKEAVGSIRGFTTFDFETGDWEHHDEGPYSKDKLIVGGSAVFAPNIGPNGLIFIFGGMKDVDAKGLNVDDYVSFETIHFLDPVTMQWHSQNTSGTEPTGRATFCASGAAVGEDGFDIFIYGGRSESSGTEYSDVYVLSLPGFRWTTVSGSQSVDRQRANHACAVIGNRHLMSWGGIRRASNTRGDENGLPWWEIADTFPQGIGLFDMTALEWTTRYDPDTGEYRRHDTIGEWYQEGGGASTVEWASPEVKALFVTGGQGGNSTSPGGDGGGPPIGPIVGGVVGGVIVIAAAVGLLWFLRRRKRRQTEQVDSGLAPVPYDAAPAASPPAEVANNEWKSGSAGYYDYPVNTGTEQVSELHAGYPNQQRSEMDGTGVYQQGR